MRDGKNLEKKEFNVGKRGRTTKEVDRLLAALKRNMADGLKRQSSWARGGTKP